MSDRRRFLKGSTSIPLATILANPRLAAAVSAGLQEVEVDAVTSGTALVSSESSPHSRIVTVTLEFAPHLMATHRWRSSECPLSGAPK